MTTLAELTKEQETTNEHLERIVLSFNELFAQMAFDRLDMMERNQEKDKDTPVGEDSDLNAGAKKVKKDGDASESKSGGFGLLSMLKDNVGKIAGVAAAFGLIASLSDEQLSSFRKLGDDLLEFTSIATGINFETINKQFRSFVDSINEFTKKIEKAEGIPGVSRLLSDETADFLDDTLGPVPNVLATARVAALATPKQAMTKGGRVEGEVFERKTSRGTKKFIIVRDPKTGTLSSQFAPKSAKLGKNGPGYIRKLADMSPNWAKKMVKFLGPVAVPIAVNDSISAINANRDAYREAISGDDVTPGAQFAGELASGTLSAGAGFVGFNPRSSQSEALLFRQIRDIGVSTANSINELQKTIGNLSAAINGLKNANAASAGSATPSVNPADFVDPVNPMSQQQVQALNQSAL